MTKPKSPRRQYIVNPSFQWHCLKLILALEVIVFATAAVLTAAFKLLILDPTVIHSGVWLYMVIWYASIFFLMSGLVFMLGIRISNRISGPLFRIRRTLCAIASGSIPEPVSFRSGDFHPELADHMNETLVTLRKQCAADVIAWQDQAEQLGVMAEQAPPELSDALRGLSQSAEARAVARSAEIELSSSPESPEIPEPVTQESKGHASAEVPTR